MEKIGPKYLRIVINNELKIKELEAFLQEKKDSGVSDFKSSVISGQ